jgi:hypothetical protein
MFFGKKTEKSNLDEIVNKHLRKLVQQHAGPCVAEAAIERPVLKSQPATGYSFKMGVALPEGV